MQGPGDFCCNRQHCPLATRFGAPAAAQVRGMRKASPAVYNSQMVFDKAASSFLPSQFPLGSWKDFEPVDRAVLTFIQDGNKLLLIHKKRGLGQGKINAPGGRLEAGETYVAAAERECIEEVGLRPLGLEKRGELYFRFRDGHTIYGEVFWAQAHEGTLIETDEALPFWCSIDEIPWDSMWEDDRHWLVHALENRRFRAIFDFEGDKMLAAQVNFLQAVKIP